MSQVIRYQEVLRKLAIIDERCVADQAGLSLGLPTSGLLDPKAMALVQVGALVAIGAPAVCLEWGATRALAAGASEEEITGVLLAVSPVAGLGRVAGAIPDVAAALGYDLETALLEHPDGPLRLLPAARACRRDWTSRQSGRRICRRWCTLPGPR